MEAHPVNLSHIDIFLTIVSTHNITKAAEKLYISQSTVSHRLAQLETELGVRLVLRGKGQRYVELTPAGERFVPIALQWKSFWEDSVTLDQASTQYQLKIGGVDSIINFLLGAFFSDQSSEFRDINMSVGTYLSAQIYDMLKSREIDLGFVSIGANVENIVLEPIHEQAFQVLEYYPEDTKIPPGAVDQRNLDVTKELFQPWGPDYQIWHDYWWPQSVHTLPRITFDNTNLITRFMTGHYFWTIMPSCVAAQYRQMDHIVVRDLKYPPTKRICYLATHKYPKVSSKEGIELFRQRLFSYLSALHE